MRWFASIPFRTLAVIVCSSVLLVCGSFFAYQYITDQYAPDPYITADKKLHELSGTEYYQYFIRHIDVFFHREGINGMIQRTINALRDGQIEMFVCHSIAHDIGHYGGYPENFPFIESSLSKENLDFCGSGFLHGVEGQLANEAYPQNAENLYTFCKMAMPYEPYYSGCYHGAGHAFMEHTRDVEAALRECDTLITDTEVTHNECYRGVFSEHVNIMRAAGDSSRDLLLFCNTRADEQLQMLCALELHGLDIQPSATEVDIEAALVQCIDDTLSPYIQEGCVRSVAGVAADHILGREDTLVPVSLAFKLSPQLLHEYIDATHGAYLKTALHTSKYSFVPFCDAFAEQEIRSHCFSLLKEDKL